MSRQESLPFRLSCFWPEHRLLIITISTSAHERLHGELYTLFTNELFRKGLEEQWTGTGATTYPSIQGGSDGGRGEGDSSGLPEIRRGGWPTLVIGACCSETDNHLRRKMEWWFEASNHDVKIVLLLQLKRNPDTITIQRWEEEPSILNRPGATTTRHAAHLRRIQRQQIVITRDNTTNPASYQVARGNLILPFQLLFLRQPNPNIPQESDIVIGIAKLQELARRIWD